MENVVGLESNKRRSSSEATEYPRRQATIAVGVFDYLQLCHGNSMIEAKTIVLASVRYVVCARHDATVLDPNVNSALNSTRTAYISSQA